MYFLLHTAAKDLRRRLADLLGLAVWLGIPLVLGTLMTLAFGGRGATPKAHVLLADEDEAFVGRLLAAAASGQGAGFLDVERVSAAEGRRRMDDGEASALVVLPKGLTRAILDDSPATLALVTNPAQRIMPEVVRTGVEMLVEAVFYVQQILGPTIRAFTGTPQDGTGFFSDASVGALSGELNRRLRAVQPVLLPPVLSLDTAGEASAASGLDFGSLMLPSMLFMSLLFVARGFSDDLWVERERGTLRRAVIAPSGTLAFLGGKLAAGASFMAAISLVGLLVTVPASHVSWLRVAPAVAWCTFTGTALVSLFTLLQFLASTARGANVVTTMVLFPMMMLGGSFFPFEAMPGWMAAIGQFTPNGQGVVQLRAIVTGRADAAGLVMATLAIGVPAAAAFVLSARLLRGRFAGGA